MQEHIAALKEILQKLHKQERPSKSELRQMAKTLGVPQRNIKVARLFENIQHAFLQSVESLREGRCDLDSQVPSSSGTQHPCLSAERDLRLSGTATRLISDIGPYITHRSAGGAPE